MHFEILETNRLLLEGISPENMVAIFENYTKPQIKKILGHRSEADYQKDLTKHKNGFSSYNRSFLLFLMKDKATKSIIGRCGLHNWNIEHSRAEIGYVMEIEAYKRKGLMTEAVNAIMAHGFNQLHLNRIEALVGTNNIASLKIMERFKFIKEGVLRKHYYTDNQFEDSILFSKLKTEYQNEKKFGF